MRTSPSTRLPFWFQKYWLILKMHWQNQLTYPVSFFFWRLRQFLGTLAALTLWTAIFGSQNNAFGYSQETMISYIFLIAILQSIILATFLNGLAQDIYTGQISNLFVKSIRPFGVWITQEIADKSMNFSFVIVETMILLLMFRPVLFFPSATNLILFFVASLMGAVLFFFIMLLFGVIGFWSQETWGPRFLFYMFIDFTAGKFFPLNVLPRIVEKTLYFTPFPYLSYVQSQIFLQKYSVADSLWAISLIGVWIIILSFTFGKLWKKGLKEYGAMGR